VLAPLKRSISEPSALHCVGLTHAACETPRMFGARCGREAPSEQPSPSGIPDSPTLFTSFLTRLRCAVTRATSVISHSLHRVHVPLDH